MRKRQKSPASADELADTSAKDTSPTVHESWEGYVKISRGVGSSALSALINKINDDFGNEIYGYLKARHQGRRNADDLPAVFDDTLMAAGLWIIRGLQSDPDRLMRRRPEALVFHCAKRAYGNWRRVEKRWERHSSLLEIGSEDRGGESAEEAQPSCDSDAAEDSTKWLVLVEKCRLTWRERRVFLARVDQVRERGEFHHRGWRADLADRISKAAGDSKPVNEHYVHRYYTSAVKKIRNRFHKVRFRSLYDLLESTEINDDRPKASAAGRADLPKGGAD